MPVTILDTKNTITNETLALSSWYTQNVSDNFHENIKECQNECLDETRWGALCEDTQVLLNPCHFLLSPQTYNIKAINWCASPKRQKVPRIIFLCWSWGSIFGWLLQGQDGDKEYNVSLCGDQITSGQGHRAVTLCQVLDWASCWAKGMLKTSGFCPNQSPLIHNRDLYLKTRQLAPGPLCSEWFFWKILSW